MQKQAKKQKEISGQDIKVEYTSFDHFFKESGEELHMDYHVTPREPIDWVHHHDALEFGYCLEGSGVFWIDGVQYPYTAPCGSLIYPGQLHRAYSREEQGSRWAFFTIPVCIPEPVLGYPGGVFSDPKLLVFMEEVLGECENRENGYVRCACRLLEVVMIRYERTCAQEHTMKTRKEREFLEQLKEVLQYIDGHYKEEIHMSKLSSLAFVHESTLRVWFKKALGLSPMQYIHQTRITMACLLLKNTELSVARIAEEVGYPSLSSFNRQFLSRCGCSPRKFRFQK